LTGRAAKATSIGFPARRHVRAAGVIGLENLLIHERFRGILLAALGRLMRGRA